MFKFIIINSSKLKKQTIGHIIMRESKMLKIKVDKGHVKKRKSKKIKITKDQNRIKKRE